MRSAVRAAGVLLAAAVLVSGSCGGTPSQPSSTPVIRLLAPLEIEPGQVVQLRLTVSSGPQAVEDVTDRAVWASGDTSVLALTPSALATGLKPGEATVSVAHEGRTAMTQILVLPKGTFRVTGRIRQSDQAVSGVRVTVLSGPQQDQASTSRADGSYALYGLHGTVRIRLSKPGYLTAEHVLDVAGHQRTDLTIDLDGPPRVFTGRYRLTIFAANGCPSDFPEAAVRRTYTADLRHQGDGIEVTLRDGAFLVHVDQWAQRKGDHFWGWVPPDARSILFWIGHDYYYPSPGTYGIAERFGDTAILIKGIAQGEGSSDFAEGAMSGSILIAGSTSPPFEPIRAQCSNLRFELERH